MVIGSIDAALEDREISLDRVGVRVATDVLAEGMNNCGVTGELLADTPKTPLSSVLKWESLAIASTMIGLSVAVVTSGT
jgi:hypothetical protein